MSHPHRSSSALARGLAWSLVAALGSLAAPLAARAQQMPPMPSKEEIERRVQEELDKIPPVTVPGDFLELTYKPIPTDPVAFAKQAAGGQIPAGVDPNLVAKQALPYVRPTIEKFAATLGTLAVKSDTKLGGKTLKEGQTYTFGLLMQDMDAVGIVLSGGDLKQPLKLPLKGQPTTDTFDPMKVDLVPDKRNDKKVEIHVGFAKRLGEAGPAQKK